MKQILYFICVVAVGGGFALTTQARADEYWNGGNGTWDFNTTPNWSGGTTWSSDNQSAAFFLTPGTVTISDSAGQVGFNNLDFISSSPTSSWDITGDALDESIYGNGNDLVIYQNVNAGNVTIDSNINVDTTVSTDHYNITNNSASSLTLNGNMTIGAQAAVTLDQNGNPNNGRDLFVGSSNDSAVFHLNGTFSDSYDPTTKTGGVPTQLILGGGGATEDTYFINGDVSGMHMNTEIGSGNMVIDPTANFGSQQLIMYDDQDITSENVAIYGAQGSTISNDIYITMIGYLNGAYIFGNGTLGAYDASNVTFTGGIGLDNSGAIFTAAAGGRATFTGDIGNPGNNSPNGLFKTGAGTVVLGSSNGNTYGLNNNYSSTPGTVAMDIQQGTLLITNTNGSAFGNNNGTVKIEAGATLGGSGSTGATQQVVAEAATAVIAPGDAGQANLKINPTIATLTLAGGLMAENGVTMDFKLNGEGTAAGVNNDLLIVSSLTLNGPITIYLTALDTLLTGPGNDYFLFVDYDGSPIGDPTFNVVAPSGYALDTTYGLDDGLGDGKQLGYDYTGGSFSVQLVATPEPSSRALLFSGLLLLGFGIRRRMVRRTPNSD